MTQQALVVDRKGLAKKLANRPKEFVFFELIQNCWDENVTTVKVTAEMLPGRPVCRIVVQDDSPEGFQNLESIYTLFRDSKKSNDPEKRGRFELGEKLVAALALRMEVCTTKGTVIIEGDERKHLRKKTDAGSIVLVDLRMTKDEYSKAAAEVRKLIPPLGIVTEFNGTRLTGTAPLKTFETTLQTIKTDEEGNLVPAQRKTKVHVHKCRSGEKAYIYEMGIPVVETGDKWHYDVQQKVPVNWERNSVPPAFLRTLRVEALNVMYNELRPEDALETWVTAAVDDDRIAPEALKGVITNRYGEKAVIFDPSDQEGTKIAVSQGYTVVPGGAFSRDAWANIRDHQALLPAGQVTPSPKPYNPEGRPEKVIPECLWTADMKRIADFSMRLFRELMDGDFLAEVVIVEEPQASWAANFGDNLGARLCLNYGRLGKAWFARQNRDVSVLDLLLHEFVHHTVEDHLSDQMHKTATRLGAKMVQLALDQPRLFWDE